MKTIVNVLLLVALFYAFATSSFADSVTLKAIVPKTPTYGVPRTNAYPTPPPSSNYDDAYYQKGAPPVPAAQFTDNTDGTVTDNGTGLMWIKDPSTVAWYAGGYDFSVPMKVSNAYDNVASLNRNGGYPRSSHPYTDWRVPNIKELQSIACFSQNWYLVFNWYDNDYWSSTYWIGGGEWYVDFGTDAYGSQGATHHGAVTLKKFVRPVRGGIGGGPGH